MNQRNIKEWKTKTQIQTPNEINSTLHRLKHRNDTNGKRKQNLIHWDKDERLQNK